MEAFSTPSHTQQFELDVKRSRFITTVGCVDSRPHAKAFVQTVRCKYPDANHHCWAVICGTPDNIQYQDQSDDGEPKGTAGKPMLNVLQHSQLGDIMVVVTRYFGGIRLGAGGLVRAYTRAVSEPLKMLETQTVHVKQSLTIELPYTALAAFEHWIASAHTDIVNKTFAESVVLTLAVPDSQHPLVLEKVRELGGQTITISG